MELLHVAVVQNHMVKLTVFDNVASLPKKTEHIVQSLLRKIIALAPLLSHHFFMSRTKG